MIVSRRQPGALDPPRIATLADAGAPGGFRLAVRDPEPYLAPPPLFADPKDLDWFLQRAWQGQRPQLGERRGESTIRCDQDRFVVLHRYGEGVIFGPEGAVNSPGFLYNLETLPRGMHRNGDEITIDDAVLAEAPTLPGAWSVFYNGNLQNYYHWLVEAMLNLELLAAAGPPGGRLLLPSYLPREGQFDHIGMIRALGHGDLPMDRIEAPYVRCASVLHVDGEVDGFPATRLRAFQARVAGGLPGGRARTLIAVRRKVLRRVDASWGFYEALEALGFQTVVLEEMSFDEQVRLFSSAAFVIGPHGAGLSNLIFAPEGCRVIELSPACEMRPFFWNISAKLGHIYGMLPCETVEDRFNGDLRVDPARFKSLLATVSNAGKTA